MLIDSALKNDENYPQKNGNTLIKKKSLIWYITDDLKVSFDDSYESDEE